jgi:hypothetical protein
MNITDINTNIMTGVWSNEELRSMADAVTYARQQLNRRKMREVGQGDTVKFYSTRRGTWQTGTVIKIAIKNVTVQVGNLLWKVPANMLELVEEYA